MRIVAGAWRGRALIAPAGQATRPTADRVRQALFDMLLHAPWGGRDVVEGARVLDAFAGTGAFGLEALSRGAAHATFMEQDRAALAALRGNVAACRAEDRATVLAVDVLAAPAGEPCGLVFLDPPYGRDLVPRAMDRLRRHGVDRARRAGRGGDRARRGVAGTGRTAGRAHPRRGTGQRHKPLPRDAGEVGSVAPRVRVTGPARYASRHPHPALRVDLSRSRGRGFHRPRNRGLRFSANAATASRWSSVCPTRVWWMPSISSTTLNGSVSAACRLRFM